MVTMNSEHHNMVIGVNSKKEYLKFGLLILVMIGLSFALNVTGILSEYMRWFMAIFFVTLAGFKFIGYEMFVMMFRQYDILAQKYKAYAYVYPFIELFLGILYFLDFAPGFREILTVVVMAISAKGVWREIKKRSGVHCACLGNVIKLPLSTVSLIEDVSMGLMAIAMLFIR